MEAIELGPADPDAPDTFLSRFVAPAVPMPPGCLFQLAPDDRLILRVYDDASVEFGDGIMPTDAAREFWRLLSAVG